MSDMVYTWVEIDGYGDGNPGRDLIDAKGTIIAGVRNPPNPKFPNFPWLTIVDVDGDGVVIGHYPNVEIAKITAETAADYHAKTGFFFQQSQIPSMAKWKAV